MKPDRARRPFTAISNRVCEAADHKLDATYTVAYIAHVPLEPRAAVAEWNDGKLTVWTGTQRPWGVKAELAEAFKIPEDRVRVIVPDTGSAYGGKHTGEAAIEAARLAKAANKPVKLIWSREEEFTWAYFRPAGVIEIRSGVIEGRADHCVGVSQLQFRTVRHRDAVRHRESHDRNFTLPTRRCGKVRIAAWRPLRIISRANRTWTIWRPRSAWIPLEFRLKNLKNERLRAVLEAAAEKFGWASTKKPARSRIRPGLRRREGRLRGHLCRDLHRPERVSWRRSNARASESENRARRHGVRMRRDRESRASQESDRRLRDDGDRRRALRSGRVLQTDAS